jgi:hypothetical protein
MCQIHIGEGWWLMAIAVTTTPPAPRTTFAVPPITRGYVMHLQARLLEAEAGLIAMNDRYHQVKARFDRNCARRGIAPEDDIVNYINVKSLNPELKYWYSKVEHFQREVTAYGAALTGLEAARRMLGSQSSNGSDGSNGQVSTTRVRDSKRALYRAS